MDKYNINTSCFIDVPKSIKTGKLICWENSNKYKLKLTSKECIRIIKILHYYKDFNISPLIEGLIKNKKHVKKFIYTLYKNNIINKCDYNRYRFLLIINSK